MQRILVCTGVLGGGTAIVFALAALTAVAFPQGTLVSAGWNGGPWMKQGWDDVAIPVPAVPAPAVEWAPAVEEDGRLPGGFAVPGAGLEPLPGDIVAPAEGTPGEVMPSP